MTVRIGVDIGGTFTDVAAVGEDGSVHLGKRLTTVGAENEGPVFRGLLIPCSLTARRW